MKRILSAAALVAFAIIVVGLLFSSLGHTQEQGKPEKPTAIDQKLHVVPDLLPSQLEGEIRKLNAQGVAVTRSDLIILNDKITIFVAADIDEDCEDCGH